MAAPIAVTGATLEPGAPVVLFSTRISGGGVDAQQVGSTTSTPTGVFSSTPCWMGRPRRSRFCRIGIPKRRSNGSRRGFWSGGSK
jgi:hypothetical protein